MFQHCQHVQVSDLFSIDECDQAVMDFLVANEVGKFSPKWMVVWNRRRGWLRCGGRRQQVHIFLSFIFHLSAGTKGSGGKLRDLAGSPRKGGDYLGPVIL